MRREPGRQHEQAPHTVNDRGNTREQLDRDRDRPRDAVRAEFDEEDRHAERQRQREQQSQDRGDDRADDRTGRAVDLGDGVPLARGQEAEAELAEGGPAADGQADDHAGERRQQQRRGREAERAEDRLRGRVLRADRPGGHRVVDRCAVHRPLTPEREHHDGTPALS